jgi:hypothetical protein
MIPVPPIAPMVSTPVTAATLLDMVGWPILLAAGVVVAGQVALVVRLALGAGTERRPRTAAASPRFARPSMAGTRAG